MARQLLNPASTERVEVDGFEGMSFEVGHLPPLEARRLLPAFRRIVARMGKTLELDPEKDGEAIDAAIADEGDLAWNLCRWGVRGWSGLVDDAGTILEARVDAGQVDGHTHPRLSYESLHVLSLNSPLLTSLALKVFLFNTLSPDAKKNSASPLKSEASGTSAPAASRVP